MPRFDDYIVFVDESGDHGMASIDREYPVFVLAFCIFEKERYAGEVVPSVLRFKFAQFGHDQVILHEREIRKSLPPFAFLMHPTRRGPFLTGLSELIRSAPFTLVASAIRKERHRDRYSEPANPYHVAMGFGLERVFQLLRGLGCGDGTTYFLFERRGAREDAELELEFRRICDGRNVLAKRLPFELVMADKKCNSAGLQLADMVARPIGRRVLAPEQPNRAYDVLAEKFRRSPLGKVDGWGLKVFP